MFLFVHEIEKIQSRNITGLKEYEKYGRSTKWVTRFGIKLFNKSKQCTHCACVNATHRYAKKSPLSQLPRCKKWRDTEKPEPSSSTSPTANRKLALASDSFRGYSKTAEAAAEPAAARA